MFLPINTHLDISAKIIQKRLYKACGGYVKMMTLKQRRKLRMYRTEFLQDIAKNRRDILAEMYEVKQEMESLLQKDFFKNLIAFYQWMDELDGMSHWMFLYSSYLLDKEKDEEDCDQCLSGKMRLLETLLFQLNETNIFDKIKDLNRKVEEYEEFRNYEL
jgi:hypothetical protein